jgi:hypothetical protein
MLEGDASIRRETVSAPRENSVIYEKAFYFRLKKHRSAVKRTNKTVYI